MASVAAWGFGQWCGASLFAGTAAFWYGLRGVGNSLADLGGLIGDIRRGEVGLVAQVFHQLQAALGQVQQLVSSPLQSLARGMISQETWSRTEESLRRVLQAVQAHELPNAIDLKDTQLFVELLIPNLMPRRARGVVPQTVNEWMDVEEQRNLRRLHEVITHWLGEGVDGEVKVAFVDVENILANFLRVDVLVQPVERRSRISRALGELTGAELLAPVDRVVQVWRAFDPAQLVPNVADAITKLCIQYANPQVQPVRLQLGIYDVSIHESELTQEQLLQMGRAFKTELEAKNIPLYAIGQLNEAQIRDIQQLVLREGEGPTDHTLLDGFYKESDHIGTRPVEHFYDFDEEIDEHEDEEEAIIANRGSEVLYIELLQQSIEALQAKEFESKEQIFADGLAALQGVRRKYRTFFQQPSEELSTIYKACNLIVDYPKLNERQQRTVANAKALAQQWLEELPQDICMPTEEERESFTAALQALSNLTIEHDHRDIVHQPYSVRFAEAGAEVAFVAHKQSVQRLFERNEGSLQRPIREVLDRVRTLLDSLGDLVNMLITAPRAILDTYTRPSVVTAIAIGILLLSSLLSAIFSGGSLHFLTALSMAGALSIGLHAWHRLDAESHADSASKALMVCAAVLLDAMSHANDKLVIAQVEGAQWLHAKWSRIPVIRHPMTI